MMSAMFLTWMWDERVLRLVTGRLRQQHRPSPTGHASGPQDQHALQQQQCMLGNRASHGGLGLAHFSSGLRGQEHWRDTPERKRKRQIWVLHKDSSHISFYSKRRKKLDTVQHLATITEGSRREMRSNKNKS